MILAMKMPLVMSLPPCCAHVLWREALQMHRLFQETRARIAHTIFNKNDFSGLKIPNFIRII